MTEVKICGIWTHAALDAAIAASADYIGLVFFPKSPRHVSFEDAAALAGHARGRVEIVALVVDPGPATLTVLHEKIRPDVVQLHGSESASDIEMVRERCAGSEIWKAVPVASEADVEAAAHLYAPGHRADMLLYDAKPAPDADLPGGTGLPFDWTLLDSPATQHPFALAGGLTPANVTEAITRTGAPIVDVSSGVETSPGEKSPELIARFIRAAKSASLAS